MIRLVQQPIDIQALLAEVTTAAAGAVVLFLGTTREFTGDKQTTTLDYEAYDTMALAKMEELGRGARDRWPLTGVAMVHRLGNVPLGEASVAIAVSSPHRDDAFCAGRWLIDTLKQEVPIWKREHWADGSSEWVHPT